MPLKTWKIKWEKDPAGEMGPNQFRIILSIFNSLLATRCREEEIGKEDGIFKKGGQSKAIMEAKTRDDW